MGDCAAGCLIGCVATGLDENNGDARGDGDVAAAGMRRAPMAFAIPWNESNVALGLRGFRSLTDNGTNEPKGSSDI